MHTRLHACTYHLGVVVWLRAGGGHNYRRFGHRTHMAAALLVIIIPHTRYLMLASGHCQWCAAILICQPTRPQHQNIHVVLYAIFALHQLFDRLVSRIGHMSTIVCICWMCIVTRLDCNHGIDVLVFFPGEDFAAGGRRVRRQPVRWYQQIRRDTNLYYYSKLV